MLMGVAVTSRPLNNTDHLGVSTQRHRLPQSLRRREAGSMSTREQRYPIRPMVSYVRLVIKGLLRVIQSRDTEEQIEIRA